MKILTLIIKLLLTIFLILLIFVGVSAWLGNDGYLDSLRELIGIEATEESEEEKSDADEGDHEEEEHEEERGDDDDDDDVPSRVENYNGLPAVRLSDDVIIKSGIATAKLQTVMHLEETQGTAEVVDFQPLLANRSEYQNVLAEKRLAEESRQASARVYERLRVLHKERANVSLSQVEEARFRLTQDKARTLTAEQKLKNIRLRTRQSWGDVLTNWALGQDSGEDGSKQTTDFFERLMQQQDVLLLVSLPYGFALPEETSFIYVNTLPDRSTARKAYLISSAAYTDPLVQGVTYYFRTSADQIRIRMQLSAWVITSDEFEEGYDVPLTSVIWYGGQPWVYVKVEDELYSRRPVSSYRETDFGWFIQDTFTPGEHVVTQGGQLLLSEELRWQIPDEDDD